MAKRSKSDKMGDDFHMMVGYCISAWADVDEILFKIFNHCVGPTKQCAIIFYKVPGLDARFSLTDEIVLSILPQRQRKSGGHDHPNVLAWNKAIKGHRDLLAIRRRIAHHPVAIKMKPPIINAPFNTTPLNQAPIGMLYQPFSWVEIYINQHERLRSKDADLKPLLYQDLIQHYEGVGALGNRLLGFFIDILSKPPE